LPVEPIVFAVFLMALTLGINVVLPKVESNTAVDTSQPAPSAEPAQSVQVVHVARVN
jgi:hypothetical protein